MLITFGGDAGMLVLGAALAATFFAPRGSHLHVSWLRWGFLVIGAVAFADAAATWWAARTDWDAIPFGEIEGVGLSDPSKLFEDHGWPVRVLVRRYLAVAAVAGLAFAAAWAWAVATDRRAARRAGE
jgi:ABC-type sugar transport system permease subunit